MLKWCVIGSIFLLMTDIVLAQSDDSALRSRFLNGVVETSHEASRLTFRARCEHSSRMLSLSQRLRSIYAKSKIDTNKVDTTSFDCAVRGSCRLQTGIDRKGLEYFSVQNDDYAFVIHRTRGTGKTSLQFVEQLGVNEDVDLKIADSESESASVVFGTIYLWSHPLASLVKSTTFKIHRVSSLQSDSGDLVRVEYEYTYVEPRRHRDEHLYDGYLICDPVNKWALKEYGGTLNSRVNNSVSVHQVVVEWGDSIAGIPFPKTITRRSTYPDDVGSESEGISEIMVINEEVPQEEFYLSHYGLPEPNFSRGWFGPWAWYLLGGAACVTTGAVLLKRRGRQG